jgi:two-component system, chemotaxis family, protein-glutamate methylesterase/glutaminase
MPVRVLVIDDSALVRNVLSRALAAYEEIEIVGAAADPFEARDLIVQLEPDVITLDVELPHMDGITFLRKVMHYHPLPVIVVSSFTPRGSNLALDALEAGALDVVCKPHHGHPLSSMAADLAAKIVVAAQADARRSRPAAAAGRAVAGGRTPHCGVIVGGSLGAINALLSLLGSMPVDAPPMLVAIHMPGKYTGEFARRLDTASAMEVREARDGDRLQRGVCLVVPGDRHAVVQGLSATPRVTLKDAPPVAGHRPSVNVLFTSAARTLRSRAVGVMLTGMGDDGARGLKEMHEAGAATVAQDEASCVVYGMPKAAVELGAVDTVASLDEIPGLIVELAARPAAAAAG